MSTPPLATLDALARLQERARVWLQPISGYAARQLTRSITLAIAAIGAATPSSRARHLRRGPEHLIGCFSLFKILAVEQKLSMAVLDEAGRRIDQIRAGIDQLKETPVGGWSALSLPPLDPAPANLEDNPLVAQLLDIIRRVAATRPPGAAPPAPPPQPPNGRLWN